MRPIKLIFTAVIAILLFSKCAKDGDTGPDGATGPAGPSLTGDFSGFINLYDVNGVKLTDHSGVVVSVEGKDISTTTTSDGHYKLTGISTGTYNIVYTKAGYAVRKLVTYQFIGGGEVYYGINYMYQIPAMTVTNLTSAPSTITPGLTVISGTLSGELPTSERYVRIFVNSGSTVSSDPSKFLYTSSTYALSSMTSFQINITSSNLNLVGIASGQAISIVAYGESRTSTSYADINTGRYVYTSINPTPSNVISITAQ